MSEQTPDPARVRALGDLVERHASTAAASAELARLGWSEDEVVDLLPRHVAAVVADLVEGRIGEAEATEWADAVDARDDLGREEGSAQLVNDALFVLGSPELLDRPLREAAAELLGRLRGAGA